MTNFSFEVSLISIFIRIEAIMYLDKPFLLLAILLVSCSSDLTSEVGVQLVSVYIASGKTQCNDDGLSLEDTSAFLTSADIDFTEPQCGYITGVSYPTVCGADTSDIYIYTIEASNLVEAENLGFSDVSGLDERLSYKTVTCPS
ncbi:hypothetical protein [Paraglaciecola sp. 2405UD69-4]|uniref:hypothetical protein n=1 Tax=Paraglaciecola sp. 2405UD69-4 TaxID=3391836 RepID=UPI0039C92E35